MCKTEPSPKQQTEKMPSGIRPKRHGQDISGQRFGRLVAVSNTGVRKSNGYIWLCRCDCGNMALVPIHSLTTGNTKSCGCLQKESRYKLAADISGQRFGKLVAIAPTKERRCSSVLWRCRCDCGQEVLASQNELSTGNTKSCGCLRSENRALSKSLTYVEDTCIQFIKNTTVLRSDNTSGHRGVYQMGNKWRSKIGFQKKTYYLGTFDTLAEAVQARKEAEEKLYGGFLDWYYTERENNPPKVMNGKSPP